MYNLYHKFTMVVIKGPARGKIKLTNGCIGENTTQSGLLSVYIMLLIIKEKIFFGLPN